LLEFSSSNYLPDDITDALATKPKPAEAGSVEYINPITARQYL